MKIGIYDRWLGTLGGGERHCLAVAEYLSRRHVVSVISPTQHDRGMLERRFDLDLSAVNFPDLLDLSPTRVTALSSTLDVFINVSQGEFIRSAAARNAWVVFFPAPIVPSSMARLRSLVGRRLRQNLNFVSFVEGVCGPQNQVGHQAVRRIGSRAVIDIRASHLAYHATFGLASADGQFHRVNLLLDRQVVQQVNIPADGHRVTSRVRVSGGSRSSAHRLEIETDCTNSPCPLEMTGLMITHPLHSAYMNIFENLCPGWGLRLENLQPGSRQRYETVASYQAVWPISGFVRHWTERYWKRTGPVIYPQATLRAGTMRIKRQQILSVGRFFAGEHNKQHRILIAAFKRLVREGVLNWELHLAGATMAGNAHTAYYRAIQNAAHGAAIYFHPDTTPGDLLRLYDESAIYWHAGGYGADPEREPIKLEHFGISIVEAMSAGCVPLVFGRGGPLEIVQHGVNGFQWRTAAELVASTRRIIADPGLYVSVSNAARLASQRFDRAHFQQSMDNAFQQLLQSSAVFHG